MAETSRRYSPYTYALDNPIYFIDPDGMQAGEFGYLSELGADIAGVDGADWKRQEGEDGTITYEAEAGDSALSLYQQHGKTDGFTAEQANDMVEGQLGENYIGEDGGLKSDVEVGDTLTVHTEQKSTEGSSETNQSNRLTKGEVLLIATGNDAFAKDFTYAVNELGARSIAEAGIYALWREKSQNAGIIWDSGTDADNMLHTSRSALKSSKRVSGGIIKTSKTSNVSVRKTVTVSGAERDIITGSRGGKYYINKNGNKTYLNRDGTKKNKKKGMTYFILIFSFLCLGVFVFKIINSPEKVNLTDYEKKLIAYFKEVALDSEFGKSPGRLVKWNSKMTLYISKNKEYKNQVKKINEVIQNINSIVSKSNFRIEITDDKSKSNSIIFLGNKDEMEKEYPSFFEGVDMNLTGLVNIEFDKNFLITHSKIFISTDESLDIQLSTILEELTQSIGLPADSKTYPNSIFYEDQIVSGKVNNHYSQLDIDIIKLLYHPKMKPGLNTFQVTNVFRKILKLEPNDYFGKGSN